MALTNGRTLFNPIHGRQSFESSVGWSPMLSDGRGGASGGRRSWILLRSQTWCGTDFDWHGRVVGLAFKWSAKLFRWSGELSDGRAGFRLEWSSQRLAWSVQLRDHQPDFAIAGLLTTTNFYLLLTANLMINVLHDNFDCSSDP